MKAEAPKVPAGYRAVNEDGYETKSGLPWTIAHEKTGYRLKLIPAGEFLMGSPEGEGFGDEHPQRRVFVSDVWMGETEVTCAQYARFLNERGN